MEYFSFAESQQVTTVAPIATAAASFRHREPPRAQLPKIETHEDRAVDTVETESGQQGGQRTEDGERAALHPSPEPNAGLPKDKDTPGDHRHAGKVAGVAAD